MFGKKHERRFPKRMSRGGEIAKFVNMSSLLRQSIEGKGNLHKTVNFMEVNGDKTREREREKRRKRKSTTKSLKLKSNSYIIKLPFFSS